VEIIQKNIFKQNLKKIEIMAKALNGYFKAMLEAKKKKSSSFTYNGKTYVATKTKTGVIVYKAK